MSLAAWYLHKADQCARMAKDAADQYTRTKFESEKKLWLEIAAAIEKDEARESIMVAPARGQASTS
jgi:hypothetical protein